MPKCIRLEEKYIKLDITKTQLNRNCIIINITVKFYRYNNNYFPSLSSVMCL